MGWRSPLFPAPMPDGVLLAAPQRPESDVLPWALPWPWGRPKHRRCQAVLEKRPHQHYGRCELAAGHHGDHALERGFEMPRWSTNLTGY